MRQPLFTLKKTIILTAIVLTLLIQSIFANPTAKVDRTTIGPNESIQLTITTDDVNSAQPNLQALESAFKILGVSQSTQVSIVNGQQNNSKTFQIELLPKRIGRITIPALSINNQQTQPINITVNKTAASTASRKVNGISVSATLNHKQTYTSAQVIYTLTIAIPESTNLLRPQLIPPQLTDATFTPLGKGESYQRVMKNNMVNIIKRRFVISVDKPTKLTIPPATLIAYLPNSRRQNQNSFFDMSMSPFGPPPKRIALSTQALSLHVLPAPSQKNWLPAYQLKLNQTWGNPKQQWKVGTPITRNITIRAQGVAASKLPTLSLDPIPNVNIYPDQQKRSSTIINQQPWSQTQRQFAIVPTQPGKITFPALRVKWWDMKSKQFRTQSLPKRTFTITAAAATAKASNPATPAAANSSAQSTLITSTRIDKTQPTSTALHQPWFWVACILFLLWLTTMLYFFKDKLFLKNGKQSVDTTTTTFNLSALEKACLQSEVNSIKTVLLAWGSKHFSRPKLIGLAELKNLIDDDALCQQLDLLEQQLWSSKQSEYQHGQALWLAFKNYINTKPSKTESEPTDLPPLYKQ